MKTPSRLALLVVGNIAAQCLYAASLLACLHAFGELGRLLDAARGEHRHHADRVAGARSRAAAPRSPPSASPGMLAALGVPTAAATAAVIAHQLAVSYLPAIPGWFATNDLVRKGLL